jgi:hypothetical protein
MPSPFSGLLSVLAYPALDIPAATVLGCAFSDTNFYTQLLLTTLVPMGLVSCVAVAYCVTFLKLRDNDDPTKLASFRAKCEAVALVVLYVFLPVASRVIFGVRYTSKSIV